MEHVKFDGTFKVLDYNISHRMLLFRKNDYDDSNTDLIFQSVFYMEIPTTLSDFILYEAELDTIDLTKQQIVESIMFTMYHHKFFVLESAGKKYYM